MSMPDAEAVCVAWLAAHTGLTVIGGRVSTKVPDPLVFPFVTIARVGGVPAVRVRLDAARIEYQVWGNPSVSTAEADTAGLVSSVRDALLALEGQTVGTAFVTAVDDDTGIMRAPDDSRDPTIPRYVGGVTVYLHNV